MAIFVVFGFFATVGGFYRDVVEPFHKQRNDTSPRGKEEDSLIAVQSIGTHYSPLQDTSRVAPCAGLEYRLRLHTVLRFRSPQFNTVSYLRSLIDPGLSIDSVRMVSTEFIPGVISDAGLRGEILLGFASPPDMKRVPVNFGAYRVFLDATRLRWARERRECRKGLRTWASAEGSIVLSVPDPNWPILLDTRMLRVKQSDEYLLQATFHNLSSTTISMDAVGLSGASYYPGLHCAGHAGPQPILLNWEKLLEQGVETDGWTVIGTDTIAVTAIAGDWCDYEDFGLHVPVETDIAPGELGRITLRLTNTSKGSLSAFLERWQCLEIEVRSSSRFFPTSLVLTEASVGPIAIRCDNLYGYALLRSLVR